MPPRVLFPLLLLSASVLLIQPGCWIFDQESKTGDLDEAEIENEEGDTSVAEEDGGPGFKGGDGWDTVDDDAYPKESKAVKGGSIKMPLTGWPETLRVVGLSSNTYENSVFQELAYQTLFAIDSDTHELVPRIASHWKVGEDKKTFTFRIDPRAHFSNAVPVTADDVLWSFRLITDKTLSDTTGETLNEKFKSPKKISKYLVQFTARKEEWANIYLLSGFPIFSSAELEGLLKKASEGKKGTPSLGELFLTNYDNKFPVGSGPYIALKDDIDNGNSVLFTRRQKFWADELPMNAGQNNFDRIQFEVVNDYRLAFDKSLKGEFDFYPVYTSQWWVEDAVPESQKAIANAQLIARKVYTQAPQGYQGFAMNLREPLFQDVNLRKAFQYLFARQNLVDKLAYGEYEMLSSYFSGGDGQNRDNELRGFDTNRASELLEEAGWGERGPDGIRIKNGQRLTIEILYSQKFFEKYFTPYQEVCKQAGIDLKLNLVDRAKLNQTVNKDHKFELASMNWGGGFPRYPRLMWHSSEAVRDGSSNITGFANDRVDELIEAYEVEYDSDKRAEMLREIDGILHAEAPYVLAWGAPFDRMLYWNKFGMPDTVLPRYGDWRSVFTTWWVDPEKEKALREAKGKDVSLGKIPQRDLKPFDE